MMVMFGLQATWRGLLQYGYLKNFRPAFVQLPNKDNLLKTFSKAHIEANLC
jgi:hypothetical protein